MLLVRRALVRIAGRDRHADVELFGVIEKGRHVFSRMTFKDRGVDVDGEALGLGGFDRGYRAVEDTWLTDGFVVVLAQSVEMDGEEEIRRGLEQMQLLFQEERG